MLISNQNSSISWSWVPTVSRRNHQNAPTSIAHLQAVRQNLADVMQAQGQVRKNWSHMLGAPSGIVNQVIPPGPGHPMGPHVNIPPIPMPTVSRSFHAARTSI